MKKKIEEDSPELKALKEEVWEYLKAYNVSEMIKNMKEPELLELKAQIQPRYLGAVPARGSYADC